ncbi:MAG TPA: hypothetical protein GYA10_01505 [Alphaproteobacteria bacterium]|nr:hypothetical protein [Alphaproteobacteria bacterium]
MMRLLAAAAAVAGLASPALATEWLNCADRDGAASMDLLLGAMDVAAVAGMTISAGDRVWASHVEYGPGDPVTVGQAYETADVLLVDAMDEAMAAKVAELRLFKTQEGEGAPVYAGTLRIPGLGAWAVSCSGG